MATTTHHYISSIPLQKRIRSHNNNGQSSNAVWHDLTKERPAEGDGMDGMEDNGLDRLPEDHLEDLLSLPIAQDLRPRKSRSSMASSSDNSASTTAFPTTSTPKRSNSHINDTSNQLSSPSSPQLDNSATASPYRPPKRSDSLRKRTQSTPLKASPNGQSPSNQNKLPTPSNSSSNTPASKKQKQTAGSTPSPSASPTLSYQQTRSRAVTGNVTTPSRKQASTNTVARRPLQASSTAMTNRQASNPARKTTTSSSSPLTSRARSSSTSLLSDPALAEYNADSKPPWLDKPTYLYKSDIEAPAPGSLADIARQAQRRNGGNNALHNQEDSDETAAANTSVRSWDDVILPAVANKIREKQMLEAQQKAVMYGQNGADDEGPVASSSKEEGLQNPKAIREAPPAEGQNLQERHQSVSNLSAKPESSTVSLHPGPPISDQPNMYLRTPTASVQQSNTASRSTSNISHHSSNHHTGRQELWQQSPLSSPTTARNNGFGANQNGQPFRLAQGEVPAGAVFDKEQAEMQKSEKKKQDKQEDTHSKGCRCVIM